MDNTDIKKTISEIFNDIANGIETGNFGKKTRVGLTILGSELGPQELLAGAEQAQKANPDIEVVVIGLGVATNLRLIEAADEKQAHTIMDTMLTEGTLDSAVTLHYSFPIGVSTVGRVITPGKGKELYLATTTGTSATERVTAMLKNTIYGIAAAKACGLENPTVGILNIDGARQVERALKSLKENGYPITFTESARSDGGVVMRGNDLLLGSPNIMVTDSLTGNVLIKMFSAFTSGGNYESLGYGYGPGIGEKYDKIICILSRASGAPVVAGAIAYAGQLAKGRILDRVKAEFAEVKKAGWDELMGKLECPTATAKKAGAGEIKPPPEKVVTSEITGIEILDLEDAVQALWKRGIYASSGMGCTGPIIMTAEEDKETAIAILKESSYL
ncbi:glycine/sarcosine/betaine reductase complex component C subunit alpha [Desulfitibacter alkalitolerans]|uniref:glycine/sarcosine/betaine reductase complex component C subunit alpha n=1 Tax=Desulfitibacter alkalitolerans TaxID=264641 RepID=UPI00048A42A6|nr:glycine/sarcosine/betaine reductase complex component C subunit alpha [Desulfitibacter alkalitolerans]